MIQDYYEKKIQFEQYENGRIPDFLLQFIDVLCLNFWFTIFNDNIRPELKEKNWQY